MLHGKQASGAFAPAVLPLGASLGQSGNNYLPLPPLQNVSISLPSGVQPVYQLGVFPLKDVVNLTIQPTDVSFTFPLTQDYPYYGQLLSLLTKDPTTNHYPLLDLRIYLGKTYLDGKHVTIDLCGCIVRRLNFNFREGVATLSLSLGVATGVMYISADDNLLPPQFATFVPPARKVAAYCRITHPQEGVPTDTLADFLQSPTKFAVVGASVDVNITTRYIHTMPTLYHAFFGGDSPIIPTGVPSTIQEGTETYSGDIALILPPSTPQPPIASPIGVYNIYIITDANLVVLLREAKIASVNPSIAAASPTTFTITFQGMGAHFFLLT